LDSGKSSENRGILEGTLNNHGEAKQQVKAGGAGGSQTEY